MGAILGALLGQKYADKLRKDRYEAQMIEPQVKDYLFNPATPISDDYGQYLVERAASHMSGDAKKQWEVVVQKAQQYKTASRAAAQARAGAGTATANPSSMPPAMAPAQGGGLAAPAPDQAQGSGGMMSQPPQVPTGISGLMPPAPDQKKTIDATPPGGPPPTVAGSVLAGQQKEASNPSPQGLGGVGMPSPGFGTTAPAQSASWFQRPPGEIGAAQVAMQGPMESFKNKLAIDLQQAKYKAEYEGQGQLFDRKLKDVTEYIDKKTAEGGKGSDAEWVISFSPSGMPMARMDRGVSAGTVLGAEIPDDAVIVGGKPRDEGTMYQRRSYGNGAEKFFPISQTLRLGYNKFGQGVQFNPKISGDAEAKGIVSLQTLPTLRQGFEWKVQQNQDGTTRLVQVPTISQTQKIPAGGELPAPNPPPLGGGGQGSTPPANQKPAGQLPAPLSTPKIGRFNSIPFGGKNVPVGDILKYQNTIGIATKQLFGDPDDPNLTPLTAYAKLADDPGARQRLGTAFNLLLRAGNGAGAANIGGGAGPVSFSMGSLGNWLQNSLGIKAADAQSQAKVISDAVEALRPEEQAYVNKMMNAIPAITGYRSLTRGSAYKFAQEALENELPFIGLGTANSRMFEQKMHALGNEPLTAMENINRKNPGTFDSRLIETVRGTKPLNAPSITPPAAAMQRVTNEAEYNALKPGTVFTDDKGVQRRKR